jgi:hypothetical protein
VPRTYCRRPGSPACRPWSGRKPIGSLLSRRLLVIQAEQVVCYRVKSLAEPMWGMFRTHLGNHNIR